MTDDYLADFERELHAAAERRQAPSRAPRRWMGPAFGTAVAAAAAVFVVVWLAGAPEREVEVPAKRGDAVNLPVLEVGGACAAREGTVRDTAVHERMGIFRRTQHAPDAPSSDQLQRLPAGDYDGRATRSPTGIGMRVLLAPTHRAGCDEDGGLGVCVVADDGRSRCFALSEIEAGRALVLTRPGEVVGVVTDGVESVVLEAAGERVEATVVENAYRAELPGAALGTPVSVTFGEPSSCAPPSALRGAVPALDAEPVDGGVPEVIRRSFRGRDSAVIARYARLWGGGDGVSYWVVPRLRCDGADVDEVCVVPRFEGEESRNGPGGSACATPGRLADAWIHFPLRGGGMAVAGLAPPGAADAHVVRRGQFDQRFPVKGGVWAGTIEGDPGRGEAGPVTVEFDVPDKAAPAVAVLNGTAVTGLGRTVMGALTDANYRAAESDVGNWSEQGVERTVVYQAPDQPGLGERIAIHLGEKFDAPRPEVREMTDEARDLGGDDAGAVVVAGRDLLP